MDELLSTSKDRRIENRRNRIRKKLNKQGESPHESEQTATSKNQKGENTDEEIPNTWNDKSKYKFEYKNEECNVNYDNLKREIVKNLEEKKKDFLGEVSARVNQKEQPFLEEIKKYVVGLNQNTFAIGSNAKEEKLTEQIEDTYQSEFQKNIADVKALALKEKESYKKKIEKYFSLLKYKDEKIKKVCEINSKNVLSFIELMRDQMEGYKTYLEDILTKTRDELNSKRKSLLNNNKEILEDFMRMRDLNSTTFLDVLESHKKLNHKIKESHEQNHLNLKGKNELLEENLDTNMEHIQDINRIIMEREKKLYDNKLLQQKNNHNLKMINFYKLEINKLREALLSIKTYYYNYKIKSKKNISELINQYERIKFQFIQLQKRQKSYEQNFQKKYAKTWDLQKSEANRHIAKLISANQIIHEQIFMKEFCKRNYKHLLEENYNIGSCTLKDDSESIDAENVKQVTHNQIEQVKKLLLQECNFLVDGDAEDEQEKLKKIFNYIGVHTQDDLELLTQLFYVDDQQENDDGDLAQTSEYTLDIIFKYYQEKEKENVCRIAKNKQKYKNRLNISLKLIMERKKQEKEYWDNLACITPHDTIELWKTFLIFIEKYYHLLKERATIIQNIFSEEKLVKENMNKINRMKEALSKL
ncbi:conserved Plasmodium protein, unknown function [Plasmodium knowlesi strain H]|uniref:Dynein regulatory complex protein 1 C-terminal domain-containing protein n=3 Tax=Plasmodium knowlesi TaxID=5850 RepID=A0A5K1V909_PLAKH|nr:conserved Plasmodium protein, unknown function [Plasmodium knowlesi strain H]OTN67813.1 Uncharacterized protein PKNOH_S05398600 [Plasmodium knowlesi]CAA9990573.1 conserved Plasmodium protein, unknown function [Plasmodium knowlesi strain H]SBO19842.1 conserved Plasmodium protein, unknown function [Plasmodium knowlesi strain H]SBO22335.1 conserved Plasmodium protein, unknown function [Plasmodium knowlesi strain H]VVS80047.1 conserved Plasmodium protein, unknown function [Plasmodium knowlesi s|eukprot:XP_002260958.1 hypothetical protein, conserved in Plasmodium species [Plasmodium knowlesi strain H]